MEEFRFQVNLGGMIEILSDHLYSSPEVYIRELLQNGVDAITGREKADADFQENREGKLLLTLEEGKSLAFRDNGVGLTKEEIHRFLAIIGESSKKDLESGKILNDYIGRFGIGLLSCFMVSDEICIRTHSVETDESYEWIGKPDGTYTIRELEEAVPVGTEIFLAAKENAEEYFERERVEFLLLHYGLILPYPILLNDGENKKRINPVSLPWEKENPNTQELMMFGQFFFQTSFMDCIVLHSEEGAVDGVAYILPYAVQASAKQNHMIYLKNMLLTEKGEGLVPDWSVFVKCIINARDLRPTASREGFYSDETLHQAQKNIGNCIADYLKKLARENIEAFRAFLEVHSLVVRSMAIDDDELFQLFINELEFETTRGRMTGYDLRMSKEQLLYCNLKEYQQLSQVFVAQGKLLINAGIVYTEELLFRMSEFFGVLVMRVNATEVDDLLKEVKISEMEQCVDFLDIAQKVLEPYHCAVEMKQFIPANLPAFYYVDSQAQLYRDLQNAKENSDGVFSDLLDSFAEDIEEKQANTLYFNYQNPIIKKMAALGKEDKLEDFIFIIYVQTLLIGGFHLRNNELGRMNDNILNILEQLL
ncbi:MAG: HSP90 family protein [Lachnospiraceae bacterium]|nr:HSP90 family protein [Lachnospiraceae bacterium]